MNNLFKQLSPRAEFIIVTTTGFGYFSRLLYHLYQGPLIVIGIVPLGWLSAYVYARWNRLWPIIIAHGILDFIALSAN